ncbi:MAG TPA: transglutaminase domain-containing protein [Candidatus Limnocylindria bacterium]|nr:transglutaminase domain-containing protein [Candidatus Limnocylindria bacterium]
MKGASPVFGQQAQTVARAAAPVDEASRFAPKEGWTAFAALAVMLATVGVALDDAVWAGHILGTRISQTSFLPMAGVLSVATGLLLAKSSLGVVRTHIVGAAVGAVYLLVALSAVVSQAPSLVDRLRALNESVSNFVNELVVLGIRSSETSVFLLTLGALLWAAGQFAAVAVFRRQRPLPAILIAAVPLLINVSLTVRDQYLHVVVFFAAALLLLVRLNLLEQVDAWRARAIGDGPTVSSAFLRSGATFIGLALVGSTFLAANTSSAPLGRVWNDLDEQLIELGYEVNRVMGGVTGQARGPSILFAPNQTIRELWESSDAIEFTALSSDPSPRGHRWRGAAYDSFDGRTWSYTEQRTTHVVEALADPLGPSAESLVAAEGRREVLVEVTPGDIGGHVFVSPDGPVQLDQRTEVQVHREDDGSPGGFITGRLPDGMVAGVPYTVRAMVRVTEGDGALTGNQLAAAGLVYPSWVERYTTIRENSVGPVAYERAETIVAGLDPEERDPYHIAKAMQDWLRESGGFRYTTDVRGLCVGRNLVDCFLEIKQGYCEYFASAMTMMLRTQGIPARYVLGYLPGRQGADGIWSVPRSAAHAWVEVYFPGYGWVEFDPTPGNEENLNQAPVLEPGAPVATPRPPGMPAPTPFFGPDIFVEPGFEPPRPVILPSSGGGGGGPDPILAVLGIVGVALALLLLGGVAYMRRMPRTEPELAYRGVARLAGRFGHGPRPTQTVYEFADGLGELVPRVRSELRVVATAKVEATYGARQLPTDALEALRRAYRRVRIGLVRLLWYRPRRRRGED